MIRDQESIIGRELITRNRLKAQSRLAAYLENPQEKVLREHQVDVMQDLQSFLEDGNTAGYVSLPTGSGKTVIITELAQALDLKTLVLSPTKTILKQTAKTSGRFSPGVNLSNYYSGEKNTSGDVLNATYQSVPALLKDKDFNPDDVELLICDEAHTALGEQRHTIFREFPNALMVGLTATPYFTPLEGYKTRGIVDPNERWTKMFSERIHEMSLEEGMERGVLAELDVHLVRTNTVVDDITVNSLGEYRKSDLERLFKTEARDALVIGMIAGVDKMPANINVPAEQIEEVKRIHEKIKGKKTAVFGLSVDHAKQLSLKLNEHWIAAREFHGEMDDKIREARMQMYEGAHGQVLVGVDLLRLGWDSPQTEVGIYLAPTKSGIVAVQELGRILRPSPETGKDRAIAIQLVDNYAQRGQAPITIMDIFNPEYVLRGTQTGLRRTERKDSKDEKRPVVTFSGLQLESIFEESRSNYLLKRKFRSADVMEMDQILNMVLQDVQKRNPDATDVELYSLFSKELPYFIGSKNQEDAVQAVASLDSNVVEVGKRVLTLINMKTILSAVELYEIDDPEVKTELVHAGIASMLAGVSTIKTSDKTHATIYIHNLVRRGVAQHIASQEGIPLTWVLDRKHAEINKQLKIAFRKNPSGLNKDQIHQLAGTIHESTGLSGEHLFDFVSHKNSQHMGELGEVADEDDLVTGAAKNELKEKVGTVLDDFRPRERVIVEMRFGIDGDAHTLREIGQEIGQSVERVRQIESEVLRKLMHPQYSNRFRPYLLPEQNDRFIYQPKSDANEKTTTTQRRSERVRLAGVLGGSQISADRLQYRYPFVVIGFSYGRDHLYMGDEITKALEEAKIHNLKDLLTKTDEQLLNVKGIGDEEVAQIKGTVNSFLNRDATVTTLADQLAEPRVLPQTENINGREISGVRLRYRYTGMSLGESYGYSLGLGLETEIRRALGRVQIRNIADLLLAPDEQLLAIPGIGEAEVQSIRGRLNLFLKEDAKVVTLMEKTSVSDPNFESEPTTVTEVSTATSLNEDLLSLDLWQSREYLLSKGISTRTVNTLQRSRAVILSALTQMTDQDILNLRQFGESALAEIRKVIPAPKQE